MESQRHFEVKSDQMAAIIFDCDGTLVDSESMQAKALQKGLAQSGVDIDLEEIKRRTTGVDNPTVLKNIEAERGLRLPADLEAQIEELALGLVSEGIQAIDGAVEVVQALARANLPLAVASNSSRELVVAMLAAVDLIAPFHGRIATRDLVEAPKPAPDVYLMAARLLAVSPERCLAVEDSPTGVISARRAGMSVAGFFSSSGAYQSKELLEAGATFVIDDLRAVLARALGLAPLWV